MQRTETAGVHIANLTLRVGVWGACMHLRAPPLARLFNVGIAAVANKGSRRQRSECFSPD
jgi:hypothetical protein